MKWSDSERGCGWEHHDRKERLAPEAERQRKWVKNKTRLMINLRPPWWGQSWTKNSIPTAQCLNYFFFLPLVLTCLPQLRSNARGHLKISTAKATQHVSPHGEGEGSAKSLSWSLYGFSTVCLSKTLGTHCLPRGSRPPAWGCPESPCWVYWDFLVFCIFILKTSWTFLFLVHKTIYWIRF